MRAARRHRPATSRPSWWSPCAPARRWPSSKPRWPSTASAWPFEPPRFARRRRHGGRHGRRRAGRPGARRGRRRCATIVLGATLLNGRGEVLTLRRPGDEERGRLRRRRACSPARWASLGVICEVSLKVLPLPPATRHAALRDGRRREALQQLNGWGGQPLPLNASAWWNGMLVRAPARVRAAAVRAAAQQLGGERDRARRWPPLLGRPARPARRVLRRRAARRCDSGATLWRLSVPPTAPPLAAARRAADRMGRRAALARAPRCRRRRCATPRPRPAATPRCSAAASAVRRVRAAVSAAGPHPPRAEARLRPRRRVQPRPPVPGSVRP